MGRGTGAAFADAEYQLNVEEFDDLDGLLEQSAPSPKSAAAPLRRVAEKPTADIGHQGGVVTFQVSGGSNIPSDGAPHKFTLFRDEYPCSLEYIAIPRLVSFAYLQAVVTNQQVTLLPGKANLFRNNRFVGTTQLANIAPSQTFKLNLGIDESLQLERDLVERDVDKRLFGGKRRTTFAYRLIVNNLSDRPATLTLTEQLPVSRNEQIKVRLTKTNPNLQAGEMGKLDWQVTLATQTKQEFYYQFMVEHAPDIQVTGLNL